MLELLKDKIYIRYWLAVVVSFLGDALTLTTILFIIGKSTTSVVMISLVFVASLLPSVIIGPMIGPIIDRFQRRHIMVAADLYRFILVGLMIMFQHNSILLLVLLFLQGIGTALFEPARIASVPSIVGMHRIPQGIALFQSTSAALKFLGPVIAGFLIAFQNVTFVFIYDMASYLLSAILLSTLTVLDVKGKKQNVEVRFFTRLKNGYSRMFEIPIIKTLTLFLIPVMFSIGMFLANYKGMMFHILHVNALEFGWIEAFFASGIVIGALFGPKLLSKWKHEHLLKSSLLIVGLSSLVAFFIPTLYEINGIFIVILWSFVIGIGESMIQVPAANIILVNIPDEIRGQGVALTNSMINAFYLVGSFTGGLLSVSFGIIPTIMVSGVVLLLTFIVMRRNKVGKKEINIGGSI